MSWCGGQGLRVLVQGSRFKARLSLSSLSLVFNKGLISVSKWNVFNLPHFGGVIPCSALATMARGPDGAPSCLGFPIPAASPPNGFPVAASAPMCSGLTFFPLALCFPHFSASPGV